MTTCHLQEAHLGCMNADDMGLACCMHQPYQEETLHKECCTGGLCERQRMTSHYTTL